MCLNKNIMAATCPVNEGMSKITIGRSVTQVGPMLPCNFWVSCRLVRQAVQLC
jgi:hypothetical protein